MSDEQLSIFTGLAKSPAKIFFDTQARGQRDVLKSKLKPTISNNKEDAIIYYSINISANAAVG